MSDDPRAAFLDAATWHGSLERAEAILAAHPELATSDIHTAAVPGGRRRTPLALAVMACVDSYWTERCSPELVRMLLDAGASPGGIALPTGHPAVDEVLRTRGA